jgi:hypothetical protein
MNVVEAASALRRLADIFPGGVGVVMWNLEDDDDDEQ